MSSQSRRCDELMAHNVKLILSEPFVMFASRVVFAARLSLAPAGVSVTGSLHTGPQVQLTGAMMRG